MGGLPWLAYEYLIDNEGDEGEADYPYTAKVCPLRSFKQFKNVNTNLNYSYPTTVYEKYSTIDLRRC